MKPCWLKAVQQTHLSQEFDLLAFLFFGYIRSAPLSLIQLPFLVSDDKNTILSTLFREEYSLFADFGAIPFFLLYSTLMSNMRRYMLYEFNC